MANLNSSLPTGSSDPRQVASRVAERHQRQIRLLTGISIFLWLLAAAGVLYVAYGALWHFYPRQRLLFREATLGNLKAEQLDELQRTHYLVIEAATIVLGASFVALTLAALCTVLLVLVSRRATLVQINRSLAEISAQLKPPPTTAEQS
ncbi:MAG TPA: hypothetical protein VGK58_14145 [Lacipirellulaceae bacterium]